MNLTVALPDDLAERLSAEGDDIQRCALEAFAVKEYRAGRLTHPELRRVLGFATHYALDGCLKARGISEPFGLSGLEQDRADLDRAAVKIARSLVQGDRYHGRSRARGGSCLSRFGRWV